MPPIIIDIPVDGDRHDSVLIDPVRLDACLGADADRVSVLALASCDSTNARLATEAREGARSGRVIVADYQTAGRGRRGRHWWAEPEGGLTFSLLWRFPNDGGNLSGLSLVVGLAVAQAIDALGFPGLFLKWPNDILVFKEDGGWAKVGGILIEASLTRWESSAVIGIGLNLKSPDSAGMAFQPGSLSDLSHAAGADRIIERHALLAEVLRQLVALLTRFSADGWLPFRSAWEARHAFSGADVCLFQDEVVVESGRCLGVDDDGALRVETADGIKRWLSGDVSLRLS